MCPVVTSVELAKLVDAARPASLTPAEWARRTGVTPQLIADFRNHGKNVTIAVFLRMLDAIGARLQIVPEGAPEALDAESMRAVAELSRVLVAARNDAQTRAFIIGAVRGAVAGARATLNDPSASRA